MLFHYIQGVYLINYKNKTNTFGVSIKLKLTLILKKIQQILIELLVLYNTFMNLYLKKLTFIFKYLLFCFCNR